MLHEDELQFAEALNLILRRNISGNIEWVMDEDNKSLKASLGNRAIHIDKTEFGDQIKLAVWLLDGSTRYAERIDLEDIKIAPEGSNRTFKAEFFDIFQKAIKLMKDKRRENFLRALRDQ